MNLWKRTARVEELRLPSLDALEERHLNGEPPFGIENMMKQWDDY